MNLLLHGVEYPEIDPAERLAVPAAGDRGQGARGRHHDESAVRRRGGAGHSLEFPRRQADGGDRACFSCSSSCGSCDGPLAVQKVVAAAWSCRTACCLGMAICARIKEELLKEFNLHTIVRLPNGVFAPYTPIPTNLLFFDRSGPTKHIWYYEQPLPEGRKNYTKTAPIQFEEFAACLAWWKKREENDRAWRVPVNEIFANGCNLDIKNPRAKEDITHLPPEQLAESILQKEQRISEIMTSIRTVLSEDDA